MQQCGGQCLRIEMQPLGVQVGVAYFLFLDTDMVRDAELATRLEELGIDEDVRGTEGLTLPMLVALGEKGVKTRDDLADLASDELREIVGESAMDNDTANGIIMKAREHWFAAEDAAAADVAKA